MSGLPKMLPKSLNSIRDLAILRAHVRDCYASMDATQSKSLCIIFTLIL
jgi:hypothetical protein